MYDPFGTLPLSDSPHYSRINGNYNNNIVKNHYIVGFNPGFALQASELNEIQEQFYLNLNLTQRMNSLWQSGGFSVPFWEGAIPRCPNCVEVTEPTLTTQNDQSLISFNVLFHTTWFYWTEASSKMTFWVYNGLNTQGQVGYLKTFSIPLNSTQYIGFTGEITNVLCCPNADSTCTDEQQQLRDNSQGDVNTFNTCGASRKKVSIIDVDVRSISTLTSTFYPIFKVTTGNVAVDTEFSFLDDQIFNPTIS